MHAYAHLTDDRSHRKFQIVVAEYIVVIYSMLHLTLA